ncbi:MAG: tyrosine recombinase XerD [Myxococcales bacterium]|nr:tyrosine recombinase XerD [Myxococcales bacterium]
MRVSLDELIDAYLDHLRVERALSKHTVAAYAGDLARLSARAAASKRPLAGIDPIFLREVLVHVSRAGLCARSQARWLSSVRGLFKFAVSEGVLPADPTELVEAPRLARKLPALLSDGELERLLRAPELGTPAGLRDAAMLWTMYASGLRVSELVRMRMTELDLEEGFVSPLGKGGKRRIVPIGEAAAEVVRAYLSNVRPRWASPGQPLVFLSHHRRGLSRQAFWRRVRVHAVAAGITRRVTPHMLRHSFATHLVRGGADLRVVQTLLGHADITTTQIYTHVAGDHLRTMHSTYHPRG